MKLENELDRVTEWLGRTRAFGWFGCATAVMAVAVIVANVARSL